MNSRARGPSWSWQLVGRVGPSVVGVGGHSIVSTDHLATFETWPVFSRLSGDNILSDIMSGAHRNRRRSRKRGLPTPTGRRSKSSSSEVPVTRERKIKTEYRREGEGKGGERRGTVEWRRRGRGLKVEWSRRGRGLNQMAEV
jgi:hypothetical protein